jgi:hypothetical protein
MGEMLRQRCQETVPEPSLPIRSVNPGQSSVKTVIHRGDAESSCVFVKELLCGLRVSAVRLIVSGYVTTTEFSQSPAGLGTYLSAAQWFSQRSPSIR